MRVVFRVDASLEMGSGHVMRCLTLAKVLRERCENVEFICRGHQGNLIDKILSNGFDVHKLKVFEEAEVDSKLEHSHWLGATQKQDALDCVSILKPSQVDWLIVDHYALDEEWQKRLKSYYEKLIVIDDLADRKHQCDILLDQTFGRQKEDYSTLAPKDCKLLLGSQYALLRPEFIKWRAYSLKRRSKLEFKQLLINMGGVDVNNVTENALDELKLCNLPNDMNITVLMGGSAPHLESVRSKMITLPYKTEVKVDVDNVAEIMANSDIAIGAAGSTTWERCCLGLPTIQIATAENQQFSSRILASHNAVKPIKKVKEINYLLENASKWMEDVSGSALKICDGVGSYRVFNKMNDYKIILEKFGEVDLCNYVNLSENEKTMVLNMRNHPQVKKWMYNQDSISETEHFEFIESLESDIDKCYFLIKQQDVVIGSVYFINIRSKKSAIFGFYANPFEQILGAGRILELTSLYFIFRELNLDKLTLEVFSDNRQVVNLHKKFGFKIVGEKNKNGKKIFCMELSQEVENESSY